MYIGAGIDTKNKFIKETASILNGAKDIVMVSTMMMDLFKGYCDEYNLEFVAFDNHRGVGNIFICSDDKAKQKVIESGIVDIRKERRMEPGDHVLLGDLLSYPPEAVRAFAYNLYPESTKISINFEGITFVSYDKTYINDMIWMFENVKPRLKKE